MEFDVCGVRDDILVIDGNGHVDLFEGSNPVFLARSNVFDWSCHSGLSGEQVQSWVLSAVGFWYESDFEVSWDFVLSVDFPQTKDLANMF